MVKHKTVMYRDLNRLGRNIARTLRRNPNAVIVCPTSFDIDKVLAYLNQRGYPTNPKLDTNLQYLTDKVIDDLNKSNVLLQRLSRKANW